MATQSHRSNGPGAYDGGTAGIQSRRDCLVPDEIVSVNGTRVHDFSSAIHVM